MKQHASPKSLLIFSLFLQFSAYSAEIVQQKNYTIRLAHSEDLKAVALFTKKIVVQDFKPITMKSYEDDNHMYVAKKEMQANLAFNQWLDIQKKVCADICGRNQKNGRLVIATEKDATEDGEKIIGLGMAWWLEKEAKDLLVRLIAVDQNKRRQGIGTALLQETVKKFDGVKKYTLYTYAEHNTVAQNFFEKHGFERQEELHTFYSDFPNFHCEMIKYVPAEEKEGQ